MHSSGMGPRGDVMFIQRWMMSRFISCTRCSRVIIMIICSIVIIINSVLTLQVSTAKPMIVDLAK